MPLLADAIERSAAPAAVAVAVDRLVEAHPKLRERLAEDAGLGVALIAVAGASRSLTQRLVGDAAGIDVLAHLDDRPRPPAADPDALVRWRHLEFLRIAARDLTGRDGLEATGASLAQLADDVLRVACEIVGAASGSLAVIGLGKLGGRELNYASDIDVMFVGDGDARGVMEIARGCFRVDADLRPEGRNGPLTRSLSSYGAYWDRWADPWEFQALLKARPVAGDVALGAAFAEAAAARLWGRPFGAEELRYVRAMKARSEGEVARRGLADREVKRGWGGIRDVEFAVQLLQLVHGRLDPALRSANTLAALAELATAGYIDPSDADALESAYRFLRIVEHRLQLADEAQVHTVPAGGERFDQLARVVGYRDEGDRSASEQFDVDLRRHRAAVRAAHERLYFRPLLEAFAGTATRTMASEAVEARLSAFGFADADRTRQALRELTRGLTRRSRLMQQLLPLLLDWLSDSADPDLGLLGLRNLVARRHRTARLIDVFRDTPLAARRVCLLLGTSRITQRAIERHPDLIENLGDDSWLAVRDRAQHTVSLAQSLGWRRDASGRLDGIRRFKEIEELRIQAADVAGLCEVEATGAALAALAETVLHASVDVVAPPVPLSVIAMGRFGGAELSYASDLDVLFVYDGETAADADAANHVTEELMRVVKGVTPAARIYLLDADLRPEGKQGPLARSLAGYATYYERWAETWERQALVRARPVAGDTGVGARFMELIEPHVWHDLADDEAREIRRMKARIERERMPPGEDPQYHLKLGRGSLSDVEWTVQLLQLEHGVRAASTMAALSALEEAGAIAAADAAVLRDAYRFCERTRNRWFLVKGGPGDSLPNQADQMANLARSLETTASALRDDYRRVTRRARTVVERLFYRRT
jgi:glutamate-ammonia-ligase adenylyltransferase